MFVQIACSLFRVIRPPCLGIGARGSNPECPFVTEWDVGQIDTLHFPKSGAMLPRRKAKKGRSQIVHLLSSQSQTWIIGYWRVERRDASRKHIQLLIHRMLYRRVVNVLRPISFVVPNVMPPVNPNKRPKQPED